MFIQNKRIKNKQQAGEIVSYVNRNVRVSGGTEAQESLQKFTDFLEAEASRGRISRALEKKILGKEGV